MSIHWLWLLIPLAGATVFGASALAVYAMALYQICFTFVREGTAIFIVRGESFDHVLMSWKGHYLNDPRRPWFNADIPEWEVLAFGGTYKKKESDPGIPLLLKMPEHLSVWYLPWTWSRIQPQRYGIYWYGLWPFKEVHQYDFEWTEDRVSDDGSRKPWHRDEPTRIMFVESFVYRAKLTDAEDSNNIPITLDYLLTVRVNNPYKARFTVTSWLERLIADSNNAAKKWVGGLTYEKVIQEKGADDASTFVEALQVLDYNLPTEHADRGAPEVIGVTLVASSLQQVSIEGRPEIQAATTAKTVAQRQAEAVVAAAEGTAKATVIVAEGDKKAAVLRAEGQKLAIRNIYKEVKKFGSLGELLQQLDAMKAPGPGEKIIWAQNPFISKTGLADELQKLGFTPETFAVALRNLASGPGTGVSAA